MATYGKNARRHATDSVEAEMITLFTDIRDSIAALEKMLAETRDAMPQEAVDAAEGLIARMVVAKAEVRDAQMRTRAASRAI